MKRDDTITAFNPQTSSVLSDYPEIPRRSKREEFVTDLVLVAPVIPCPNSSKAPGLFSGIDRDSSEIGINAPGLVVPMK